MIRSFKYPLRPTRVQASVLLAWLEVCRELYNAALQERRDAWSKCGVTVTRYAQQKQLAELRQEDETIGAVPSNVLRSMLYRCDRALQGFFRRCKTGGNPGFPRFRKRNTSLGFAFVSIRENRVFVPKIGPVKFHRYQPLSGTPRQVTIGKEAGKWFVSFVCDVGEAPAKVPVRNAVGIDLGLTNFVTLTTGETVENPRYFRRGVALYSRRCRLRNRKQHGSAGHTRATVLAQKAYQHIWRQRLDHARKLAAHLFSRFDLVVHEDLAIGGMIRGPLTKSIHDAGWGMFLRCMTSKAESAGKHLIAVDPRGTTLLCSSCGTKVPKTMHERVHSCPSCGLVLDRDHNAAINILARAPGRGAVSAEGDSTLLPTTFTHSYPGAVE